MKAKQPVTGSVPSVSTAVLFGRDIDHELFNDAAVGRAMDAIYETGTQQVFSHISFNAISALCPSEEIWCQSIDGLIILISAGWLPHFIYSSGVTSLLYCAYRYFWRSNSSQLTPSLVHYHLLIQFLDSSILFTTSSIFTVGST
ncbi:MAG: DUF4277 domain-containing protein [Candidatus Sabulitectum sp.]|nr:DUF4277 domain-containing protein [Candidatus Sabulitectum sp.]